MIGNAGGGGNKAFMDLSLTGLISSGKRCKPFDLEISSLSLLALKSETLNLLDCCLIAVDKSLYGSFDCFDV